MNNYYLYDVYYKEGKKQTSATVVFCPGYTIDSIQLQQELKTFYSNHFQTDKTVIIAGKYLKDFVQTIANTKKEIFKYVPKIEETSFYDNLHVLTFDIEGNIQEESHEDFKKFKGIEVFKTYFLNQGLTKIFVERGGLVESTGSHHHFMFPSGRKHSDKFLRVANILLYSSEIYFIAFSILKHFRTDFHKEIYCDTSAINSVAIALNDLLNKFIPDSIKSYPVNSFRSYEGLYSGKIKIKSTSFILISASTSGNILEYIIHKNPELKKENIIILFYLDNTKPSKIALEQVICNLTKDDKNPIGIERFDTYESHQKCELCSKGSYPIEISGDVFLLEKPKINGIKIDANDMDVQTSSAFINQFMSLKRQSSVIKTNYKETGDGSAKKYDVYIDYSYIIDNISSDKRFNKHKEKLESYIHQYVPSNLKYILYLNDAGSKKLALYIHNKIKGNYCHEQTPEIISQNQFQEISKDKIGSILIVGSCITNGKNLLYLSRALRDYKLRIVYFVGIIRPNNDKSYKFLKTNLKYGKYGPENSTFVEVEKIFCPHLNGDNSWQIEVEFLKKHLSITDDQRIIKFLKDRIRSIEDCYSNEVRGMHSNLFLPRIEKGKPKKDLRIRRNSAFFNREDYADHVSQSDVYFNIAYVLNKLRNSDDNLHTLKQSGFVRNVISPDNLNRFNDGIIQASILRAAQPEELNYQVDDEFSKQLKDILLTIFKYRDQEQGEALLEFLYALSIKKIILKHSHLMQLIKIFEDETNYIIKFYVDIIQSDVLGEYIGDDE
ncbi:hypothetical protein [Sphingobacterium corticibacterium]|uniref:Uncharacterized protein n=1 Tax=Sphingobacterium corticibacterium TaxID=2484746 RepID=A0A4Q6XNJ6_9SPHI|nr:hypothetical protein [Sphingobacterium corticibacterium]RZF61740.1 hypothetical protein EWE74_02560 [Sphingobacterium corticibacterium]